MANAPTIKLSAAQMNELKERAVAWLHNEEYVQSRLQCAWGLPSAHRVFYECTALNRFALLATHRARRAPPGELVSN